MSAVLLLLPPSEAKVPGGDGPPLQSLDDASTPLVAARRDVLTAVAAFCRRSPAAARSALKLPPGSAADDLADNIAVLSAPTMPVLDRFTGVLFAALDTASLSPAQRRRARSSILVFSGAFGVLEGDEPVPAHRVPAAATLPRIGGLTPYWRKRLPATLGPRVDSERLVVDLRSSDYAAMWQPTPRHAARVVVVRVLEDRGGTLRSVSWSAKRGKGLLARELVCAHTSRTPVRTVADVAAGAKRIGYGVQERTTPAGAPGLDLIVPG
jgi:hypothetical protein